MPQKPITYYAETPAIQKLCALYGAHWQNLGHLEKLAIASAIAEALFCAEAQIDTHGQGSIEPAFFVLCSWMELPSYEEVSPLLQQLDSEVDASMAARLLIGIYSNVYSA